MILKTAKGFSLFILCFVISILPDLTRAQTIPVGSFREKQIRIQQLFNDSISASLANRPFDFTTYEKYFEHANSENSWWNKPHYYLHETYLKDRFIGGGLTLGVFEPVVATTFNSKHPYNGSRNNGAAWYGSGFTTEFRGGAFLTSKYLTITFRPHIIFTQNRAFKLPRFVPRDNEGNVLYGHKELGFRLDAPFRFGPDRFTKFSLAQSSIRLHYKSMEAGIGTTPLWWGPGIHNALVLSNNAAGLQHVFLGTRRPLQLPLDIGQIEFKLIGAWPKDSKYYKYIRNTDQRRFMSGINFVFTPSFVPHLHLGITRIIHSYIGEDGLSFADYIKPITNIKDRNPGSVPENQLMSVYFRWVFPGGNAEVYGEYFREDNWADFRDLMMEPGHDRAYTLGIQKIIPLQWIDFAKVNFEFSTLVPNEIDKVRHQTNYYTHSKIRQGHTNEGQILGAAIGTGSASQFLGVEGYFKNGMVGIFAQRVADNDFFHFKFNDRYVYPLPVNSKDYYNHLIHLNLGLNAKYKIGNILLGGRLIWRKTYNYGRYKLSDRAGPSKSGHGEDLINLQLGLSARYFF